MLTLSIGYGHSFLSCTNFVIEGNQYYCQGYPRNYTSLLTKGADAYTFVYSDKTPCSKYQTLESYTEQYPVSQVTVNSNVTLTWPSMSMEHDLDTEKIGRVKVYWTDSNEPTMADFKKKEIGDLDFTSCLPGGILCSGNITIPTVEVGQYKLLWFWDNYTTCFDYKVETTPVNGKRSELDITKSPGSNTGDSKKNANSGFHLVVTMTLIVIASVFI